MEKDFSKCQCSQAGWCSLFNKEMTANPPNWQWCQGLTPQEREDYYDKTKKSIRTLRQAIKSRLVDVINFYDELPEKQSDYAICVIAANDIASELLDITRESIQSYAKRCNADYIELSGDQHPYWPMANKYRLYQVTSVYKKTLYLDCDIVIREDAPNIFDNTPDDKISAYDEYDVWTQNGDVQWIKDQQELIIQRFCSPEFREKFLDNGAFIEPKRMLNGGVLVIPNELSDYYKQPDDVYPKQWCFDQNLLTLMLPEDKLHNLDRRYNCLYSSRDFYVNHKDSYFIHANNLSSDPERRKFLLTELKEPNKLTLNLITHETFSMYRTFHRCETALTHQEKKNAEIREYVNYQEKSDLSFNNVCILCLGHSDKQFKSISDRPYIKKINLNTLNCGKYSGNEWAESRAFLSEENLFPASAEFYGFTTASWNLKYLEYSRIDNFHKWPSASILLNSKPEDRIVLCADMFCWCNWINDISCHPADCVLKSLLGGDEKNIGRQFFKLMKLDRSVHKRVAYSNQQIYHKSLYFEWKKYLEDNDCLNKVKWFVDKITSSIGAAGNSDVEKYSNTRLHAYFMEMLNITWFTNNDFKFISNTTRKNEWYNISNMSSRSRTW